MNGPEFLATIKALGLYDEDDPRASQLEIAAVEIGVSPRVARSYAYDEADRGVPLPIIKQLEWRKRALEAEEKLRKVRKT